MREIIDDMFFWNADDLSIEDFCEECFETKEFVEGILGLQKLSFIKNQKNYNQNILDIKYYGIFNNLFRFLIKDKEKLNTISKNNKPDEFEQRVDSSKAIQDPYQKKLE